MRRVVNNKKRRPVIETGRLIIRRFKQRDWLDLCEYMSREAVVKFEPYGTYTEQDAKNEAKRRAGDDNFWAVCLKDGGKLIGSVYLAKLEHDAWELGYVFSDDYHGAGYATEASRALIDDAFINRNARRVVAKCDPLNVPSWRLLERLGLRREAHFIKNIYFDKDERGEPVWKDTYEYAALKEEWIKLETSTDE